MSLLKRLIKSRTIQGVVVMAASNLVPFGLASAGIADPDAVIGAVGTILGALHAVRGRIKAKGPLT